MTPIRPSAASLLLFLLASSSPAKDERPGPADHLKVLTDSKILYEIRDGEISEEDAEKGLTELSCGRRNTDLRVIGSGDDLSLVEWELSPPAREAWQRAEEHFAASRLDDAQREYAETRRLAPEFAPGWLYSGDVSFQNGAYEEALEFYRKSIEIDPTLAQAHRFEAHALEKLRRDDEAVESLVRAIALDPTYSEAFDALERIGRLRGFYVDRHLFRPVARVEKTEKGVSITVRTETESIGWMPYAICKAVWRYEPKYRAKRTGERGGEYSWSTREEEECLLAQLEGALNAAAASLSKKAGGGESGHETSEQELFAALPDLERHLADVAKEGLLFGYVLFEVAGPRCPLALSMTPDDQREEVRRYVRRFVIRERKPDAGSASPPAP